MSRTAKGKPVLEVQHHDWVCECASAYPWALTSTYEGRRKVVQHYKTRAVAVLARRAWWEAARYGLVTP